MMNFCPHCNYRLHLQTTDEGDSLYFVCNTCGFKQKNERGGLILETAVQEKASDSYKVFLNEFTIDDPTLPHTKTLTCPNPSGKCASKNPGVESDVIYIKYDASALKYLYICTHCKAHWRTR